MKNSAFIFFTLIASTLLTFVDCSFAKLFSKLTGPRKYLVNSLAITTVGAFSVLPSIAVAGNTLSSGEQTAVDNIIRVQLSLRYIDDDINNGSKDAAQVVASVKTLIKNYNFKENIAKTVQLLPNGKKTEGKEHGQTAIEDLANIYE